MTLALTGVCYAFLPAGCQESSQERRISISQGSSDAVSPVMLYRRCWKLINDLFYDQTFNGQNWQRWEHHYDGKIKTSDDAYKAIETMLASLGDPYTRFLNPEAFMDEKNQISAHLFGVGIQLGMSDLKKVVVIAPIHGSPAFNAGVLPGDEIIEVDGKIIAGQSLDTVVKQIRGPIDSEVKLTMLRDGKRITLNLKRAEIPIKAVTKAVILPGNIGYIRLDSFISVKAPQEVREALEKVESADGLILDLRNNPGGLLDNSVQIANMFLQGGIIVSTKDSAEHVRPTMASGNPIYNKPIVTLVNEGSASAAEILAAALKDNQRATLVGDKTFGKGLVQAIQKLDDGSGMNFSIARYLTAGGADIHKKGVHPNIKVTLSIDDYKAGIGPWWIDPKFRRFNREPTDGYDLALLRAINAMKNELNSARGIPAEPFDEAKVKKEVLEKLASLSPAKPSSEATP